MTVDRDNPEPEADKTPILLHPTQRSDLFSRGQRLFNNEQFFEAHEVWEELWQLEQGRDRIFLQGLIQIAGHLVHLEKGNWSGASSLGESAKEKLKLPPAHQFYRVWDIAPLVAGVDYNLGILSRELLTDRKLEESPPGTFLFPKLLEIH